MYEPPERERIRHHRSTRPLRPVEDDHVEAGPGEGGPPPQGRCGPRWIAERRLTPRMSRRAPPAVEAIAAVRRQRASLERVDHRPFAVPPGPWVMGQRARPAVRTLAGPREDAAERSPERHPNRHLRRIRVDRVSRRSRSSAPTRAGLPPLPWLSRFPELNVRTYTTIEGRPGIWFFSLDAARAVTAAAARLLYRLPYRHAHMAITRSGPAHPLPQPRHRRPAPPSARATSPLDRRATPRTGPSSISWRLLPLHPGSPRRRATPDIHHAPWPLQPARAELTDNTVTEPLGIRLPGQQPLLHYAARQDVLVSAPCSRLTH